MKTELSFAKQPFCYGSYHFWIMNYENWELSYRNCEAPKYPLYLALAFSMLMILQIQWELRKSSGFRWSCITVIIIFQAMAFSNWWSPRGQITFHFPRIQNWLFECETVFWLFAILQHFFAMLKNGTYILDSFLFWPILFYFTSFNS